MVEVFRSKVDLWLAGLILGAAILAAATLVIAPISNRWDLVGKVAIAALAVGLPLWILLGTRYELGSTELMVRCGPFRWRVPLAEIQTIRPTRNPLSSPALSLDRLEIRYGIGRVIMISPDQKDAFIRAIENRQRSSG
jgi:membrane protein YdbS with pleckstrin-like domain